LPERRLEDGDRRAIVEELAASNLRVMRALAPLLILVHGACVIVYARLHSDNPAYREWIQITLWLHAIALLVPALIFVTRRFAEAGAIFYVLLGAVFSANAQRSHGALHGFTITSLAAAVLFRTRPSRFIPAVLLGTGLIAAADVHYHPDPTIMWSTATAVSTIGLVALAAFFITHIAKVRELIARRALQKVNADLEQRVEREVREKVMERSEALSRALQRLGDQASLAPGTVLGDRFEIDRPLGFGGMGVVYRGRDRATHESVAIKLIQATTAQELESLHRFLNEAKATASVQHPAVVRSLYVDVTEDGRLYQVMELVDGVPLDVRLRSDGALGWGPAARLGAILGEALAAAHAVGIVHRDVKPPNIMLMRAAPGLKLLDFGVSKLREQQMMGRDSGSRLIGTPEFMAPEQIIDATSVGEKADVYALGLVIYHAAAGKAPFDVTSPTQWLHAHTLKEPIDLRTRVPDAPAPFCAAVMRCLQKSSLDRPSAAELAKLLSSMAEAARIPALELLERARKPRAAVPVESDPTMDAPAATVKGGSGD
jgi:serine/threonine-protein kinase